MDDSYKTLRGKEWQVGYRGISGKVQNGRNEINGGLNNVT